MRDRVIDALDSRFINRMREWARERVMPSASNVPSSWPTGSGSGSTPGSRPPCGGRVMQGRVHDTEMALAELPERYQQVVRQYWLYEGRSLNEHARRRGVEVEIFITWATTGHELLTIKFNRDSARWKREREGAATG